ncbi:MAG: AzlC family ABC transporter permease [Neomegalonema sp.]|nr:AzlC family ABC transporter permease [Neomegalonema sp.]
MTNASPPLVGRPRIGWAVQAGLIAILPTQLFVVPFGLVSGVVASEIGLDLAQTMFLSIALFAGASQFATMELLRDNAPAVIVIATGLAINLRFIMYAAALSPWVREAPYSGRVAVGYLNVDNVFAAAMVWYRAQPQGTPVERVAFHLSAAVLTWVMWQICTLVGFYFGAAAPDYLALEFSAPIAFLALAAPVLVDRPSWLAAAVATATALALHELPFNLNVVAGGGLGIMAGYYADRALEQTQDEGAAQ